MHQRGLKMEYLPTLYKSVNNRQVRKYLHTCMVARLTRDYLLETMGEIRQEANAKGRSVNMVDILEESLKCAIEGGNNNSNELWKNIGINFRKAHGFNLSIPDIEEGFYLASLL